MYFLRSRKRQLTTPRLVPMSSRMIRHRPWLEILEDRIMLDAGLHAAPALQGSPIHPDAGLVPASAFINGGFNQGAGNLDGWVLSDPQQVMVNAVHQAVLSESPSAIEVDLYQDFAIPQGAKVLSFTLTGLTFDDTLPSGATPDAFGASLLDPNTQSPLGSPFNNSTDSYYIQDLVNGVAQGHAATDVTVTPAGGSLRITLDVSALQGQDAELLFRLVGGSDVTQLKGSVGISDVTIGGVVTSTTTTAADQAAPFSTSDQQVTLNAFVASGAGPVNEGTVTFSVLSGNTLVGTAVTSATVSAGVASASYKLPGNSPAGSYTIVAAYNAGADFDASSDNAHTLVVQAAATSITAAISPPSTPITAGGPVSFSVTYTGATFQASNLSAADVHLIHTGTATGTLGFDNSTGASRTVTITNISGDGSLSVAIDAGSATDLAGNSAGAAGPSLTFLVDNTPPLVSISAPAITKVGDPVVFTVNYTDAHFQASNLSAADVRLIHTGTATGTLSFDNSTGSSRTVTITNMSGDGTLSIAIDAGSAHDLAGNQAAAAGPSATFLVGTPGPLVSISPPSAAITTDGPVSYTVTYTSATFQASNLSGADVHLIHTGTATGTLGFDNSTGANRTVTITNISGDGTLGIVIDAGSATDQTGTAAAAAGPSTPFIVDNTFPKVAISPPSVANTISGPVSYTVTYSDANFLASNLSTADVHLIQTGTATGTLSFDDRTGASRTVTISNISGTGTLAIAIDAGSASDQAGNQAAAAGPSTALTVGAVNPAGGDVSISFSTGYASLLEPTLGTTAPYYFTITLAKVPTLDTTVFYSTRDGSAVAGDDYLGLNYFKVLFRAGSHGAALAQTVAVQIKGDYYEGQNPETFQVVLVGAYNATIDPAKKIAIGTIVQTTYPLPVTVDIANYTQPGPTSGKTVFNVPVTLTNLPATQPVTVYFSTSNGTAKAGSDYGGINHGHVTIPAGQTSTTIPITIYADASATMGLTFTLTISNPLNAALGTSVATITIAYPAVAANNASRKMTAPSLNVVYAGPSIKTGDGDSMDLRSLALAALDQVFAEMPKGRIAKFVK